MSKLIGAAEYKQLIHKAVHGSTNKYRAKRTTVGDTTYASKKEANVCEGLRLRLRAGEISELELQRRFRLEVNGQLICTYVADATYLDKDRRLHVVDVKGGNATQTPLYKAKKKLMKAIYGIEIEEV